MRFRTEIKTGDAPKILSPERLILLAGSCFSDNIGARIEASGWPAVVNPCGVIYNPVSMAVLFQLALAAPAVRRQIVESSITTRGGKYVSWLMGSKALGDTPGECADRVCECLERLAEALERAGAAVLTFGTPDVWLLKGTDRAVGNCHKHPAAEFERRRAGIEEISGIWKSLIETVMFRNPDIRFILTVSPRRYLSEGFADNTRLKAVLALACESLCRGSEGVFYFPAYEILNDDLRDYRFYAPDLLHPSESAVEYIWEKFTEAYLSSESMSMLREMENRARRERHRPIMDR